MPRARRLTSAEIDLLQQLFAGSIDYAAVRVHARRYLPFQPEGVAMAPNGSIFFSAAHFSADFSAEPLLRRAWFVHEMVHVWQHQNKVTQDLRLLGGFALATGLYGRRGPASGLAGRYLYEYDHCRAPQPGAALELGDFGYEQQAMIIEDYYRASNGKDRIGLSRYDDPRTGLLRRFLKDRTHLRRRRSWRLVFPPSLVHDRGAL